MSDRIRVAIVGGGLAACTLANGLLRHPLIEFSVFESKPTFNERGAAVGLAVNAESALREMGLQVDQMLEESLAMPNLTTDIMIISGPFEGQRLLDLKPQGGHSVMRNRWLDVLLKDLPPDNLHGSKKLISITQSQSNLYTLHFEDGSSHEADAVVGCDGVRSKVREIIFGEEHKALVAPVFGGFWDARGKTTTERAAASFGTGVIDPRETRGVALAGEGAFMLFGSSEGGKTYNCIMSAMANPEYDTANWKKPISEEFLRRSFTGWPEQLLNGVVECLVGEDTGPGTIFSQWETQKSPTYYRGGMCILGDAAHSTTPWMGQGACMATEDAAVLSALLGSVEDRSEVCAAMKAFDQVRRGRPEFVIRKSHEAGKILTGQYGLDPTVIAKMKPHRWWDVVRNFDMKAHIREAIQVFNQHRWE